MNTKSALLLVALYSICPSAYAEEQKNLGQQIGSTGYAIRSFFVELSGKVFGCAIDLHKQSEDFVYQAQDQYNHFLDDVHNSYYQESIHAAQKTHSVNKQNVQPENVKQ